MQTAYRLNFGHSCGNYPFDRLERSAEGYLAKTIGQLGAASLGSERDAIVPGREATELNQLAAVDYY